MKIILMLFLIFGSINFPVHQDTEIILKRNGTLVGLPEKYSPARFDKSALILEVASNRIKIPDCVTKHFASEKNLKFYFTSSWYHDKSIFPGYNSLPNYLSLIVSNEKMKVDIQILFNLETLEIFEINKLEEDVAVGGVKYCLYNNEQEISKTCKKEILNSITKK